MRKLTSRALPDDYIHTALEIVEWLNWLSSQTKYPSAFIYNYTPVNEYM